MGQRSQIYVRETVGDTVNLIARYYGWNYGSRMISRCRYTLEWLKEKTKENSFNGKRYPILASSEVYKKLERVLDTNFDFKDVVLGQNIIDEYYEQYPENDFNAAVFFAQDNNNGKLLIDIKDGVLKYAFLNGDADLEHIMSAEEYMAWEYNEYENWRECEHIKENGEVVFCEANFPEIEKLAILMTKEEVEEFLSFDYKSVIQKPYETQKREKEYEMFRTLVLEINNSPKFECMDIDNPTFIEYICTLMQIKEWKYRDIMNLDDILQENVKTNN